jgi:hypothetical protein
MRVRDLTLKKSEYKGRPTDASDEACPCRPCYNAHDCGNPKPIYKNGLHVSNNYKAGIDMQCATRYNRGCPGPKPEPVHQYSGQRGQKCLRCGQSRGRVWGVH